MRTIITLVFIALTLTLWADPNFYPPTVVAEDFCRLGCENCLNAFAGLEIMHDAYHPGEMISMRYYTDSGDLSSQEIQTRFEHYLVYGVPSLIFGGKTRIDGGGDGIADGSIYANALKNHLYHASPLKIQLVSFNPQNGQLSGTVTMLSPELSLVNQRIFFVLVEDDVQENATRVVRRVVYQNFNLSGANATADFSHTFEYDPAWDTDKLWAAVFVQQADNTILQAVSSLAQPEVHLRAAFDWEPNVVVDPNSPHNSQDVFFFNLGIAQNYQIKIVVDSAPEDWGFNYCDSDGNCYPGSVNLPFDLAAGEIRDLHLNLWVGSSGIAEFHWEITSDALGTYIVPFRYRTSDMAVSDPSLVSAALSLGMAYPNPFRSTTSFQVHSLKTNHSDAIQIFNLRGQMVKELPLARLNLGENTITWQLNSEEKKSLGSGIYFYRLKSAPQAGTKKLLMLR